MHSLLVLKTLIIVVLYILCKCHSYRSHTHSHVRTNSFSVIMFLSNIVQTTLLNIPAVTLLLTFISYGNNNKMYIHMSVILTIIIQVIAALKNQPHASTKILGGTGVDNVV